MFVSLIDRCFKEGSNKHLWRALPSQRKVTVALEVLKIYAIGSAELFVCDQIQ